ncbi:MAG: hypothetical protein LBU04_03295 [Christensenellaceae bacterium]|jgi:hypothetical protein|nr:hypothetical protein [Christensenellaceae bacterium]
MTVEPIKTVNVLGLDFSMPNYVGINGDSRVARFYLRSHKNSPEQRKLSRRKKSGKNRAKQRKKLRIPRISRST